MRPDSFFDRRPPERPPDPSLVFGCNREGSYRLMVGFGLVLALLLLAVVRSCTDPFPEDLRESGSSLSCPPHRESDDHPGVRTAPASREKSSSSVVVPGRLRGPVQLDGPALLSTVPARSLRRTLPGRSRSRPIAESRFAGAAGRRG